MPPRPVSIRFDSPSGEFSPALTCRDFAATTLGTAAAKMLDGMRTRFVLDRCIVAGRTFHVTITYESQALSQVELFLLLPGEKAGWENWSQETEQRRKQAGERWLADVFAQPVAVLPLNSTASGSRPSSKPGKLSAASASPGARPAPTSMARGDLRASSFAMPARENWSTNDSDFRR